MKREEILELMNAKDAEIQADIDFNKHVFETIKQPVMDEIITYCIKTSDGSKEYTIEYTTVKKIVVSHIFEMDELPINDDERCRLKSLHIILDSVILSISDDEVLWSNANLINYMERLELFSVYSNISDMLEDHGFKFDGGYHQILCGFSTTKENLLRYPEIIHKGVEKVDRSKLVEVTMIEFETVTLNNGVKLNVLNGTSHITLFGSSTYRSWTDGGMKSNDFLGKRQLTVFEYMEKYADDVVLVFSRQDEQLVHNKAYVLTYIDKWLDGEKIQYKLTATPDDDKQWHNFTQGAFQYIKRSDIHFRVAPKYVELNGITFNNIASLIKHVKNNYDMVE